MAYSPQQIKLNNIISIIKQYGGIDGSHHKQWLLDQIIRIITEENYDDWIRDYCDGEDGPGTYEWDEGIAP